MKRRDAATPHWGVSGSAPLRDRGADEIIDERLEWDRDGQYFHYLTKWVHALCRTAFVMRSHECAQWAGELAQRPEQCRSLPMSFRMTRMRLEADLVRFN
jgi:hypothetical protein